MPKVVWSGDATGAVRAQEALVAAQKKSTAEYKLSAAEAKKFEDQARRIVEANDPQAKYNRHLKEANEHYKAGRISAEQLALATKRYRQELDDATRISKRAFDPKDLFSFVGGLKAAEAAAAGVRDMLQSIANERKKSADAAFASRAGLGGLSQLAASERNPAAAFERLVAEARGFVSSGAAATEGEAGALLFELASAGLGRGDRSFAARLRGAGTLQNVGGAAQAFDALTTALGAKEVGSFREFMSKALRAAGPAPGSFEQLPIAAAQAGASAKALGVSDEFLLAATTLLGKERGSIDEGGTLLAALLRGVEKSGVKGVQGVGGVGIIERIAALPEKQQGFGGVLGDRAEAVSAFRTLRDNLPALVELEKSIASAQASDLAGAAAALPSGDLQLRASLRRAQTRGRLDVVSGDRFATGQLLVDSLLDDIAARRREESPGILTEFLIWADRQVQAKVPFITPESMLRSAVDSSQLQPRDPSLARDIRDYLQSIDSNQKSKVTTRAE